MTYYMNETYTPTYSSTYSPSYSSPYSSNKISEESTSSNSYIFLFLTIISFIIFIAFYVLFLYIPAVEGESEFNQVVDQADNILRDANEIADTAKEVNDSVQEGFVGFCDFYNTLPGSLLFGNAFVDFCFDIS